MESVISGQWWRSHQSLACKGLCILRFCVMSCRGESEPNVKYCLGTTAGMVRRFITIQNFGHNWRRADGIRVEHLPRIHLHCSSSKKSKSSWTKWAIHQNLKDELTSCRFQRLLGRIKDNEQECIANSTIVSSVAKRFPAGRWSFLGPGSKTKWVFYLQKKKTLE